IWWLIEPRQSTEVIKYSGTMSHPTYRPDLLGRTMETFAHFIYLESNKHVVMADLQGIPSLLGNGDDGIILFDPMTHTVESNSGVSDHGNAGINKFTADHHCRTLC
ncbi:hypothetical protein M422DRAFT_121106, partial [Sphaerobolus stellatus SS14]